MYFLENLHFIGAWFRQSKCVVMMTKEGYTKIVNFITPGAGILVLWHGHICHIVKMHYFIKNIPSPIYISDKLGIHITDDHGKVFQNFKFHDLRGRISCARAWPYRSYIENALSSTL